MQRMFFLIAVLTGFMSCQKPLDNFYLKSPDGGVELNIALIEDKLNYRLHWNDQEMTGLSALEIIPNSTVKILKAKENEVDSTWNTTWEQFSSIRDNYKELELDIQVDGIEGKFLARAYNEGIAFRFLLKEGEKPTEAAFKCSYLLPKGSKYFAPLGENEPLGPLNLAELDELQSKVKKNGKKEKIHVPLVVESPDHSFMALLESDLYAADGFETMHLGINMPEGKIVSINEVELSKKELTTPWRVILLGKAAGDLVVNTVPINLATPCKLEDTDWIKPGKTMWDWRVHGYTASDGFVYNINTESYFRFIDFAADKGIEYFLIDAGWYSKHSDGNFEESENLNLSEVMKYAKEKNVDIILYYDRQKGDFGDPQLFPYYSSLGAKGIKYGFMRANVPFTKDAIRRSAESKLLIDFHDGPLPYTGIHRTYPNAITREYCHAQQDSRRAFTPESFIKMALINAITGPLDMNNGNFDLTGINQGNRMRGPRKTNSYFSTVASEAARTLIIFSGLVCIPDAPEAYASKADLFEFIQKMPVGKWAESRIIHSKIGEYITTARRNGKEWFIGSVYNQQGGTLDIKLDFLEEKVEFNITYYEDTEQTHCKTNPETYQVRKGKVKKGDVIKAVMAPGGGHCMWIRPTE